MVMISWIPFGVHEGALDTGVPRGGWGFTPPIESSEFVELCVCKIYCRSSAHILIKS